MLPARSPRLVGVAPPHGKRPPTQISLILSLILSGCAAGPTYAPPAIALEAIHSAATTSAASSSARLDRWWTSFNDPQLSQVVERALAQNLDLTAALARVSQARAAQQMERAQLLPAFDGTAQAETIHQSLESPTARIASRLPGYQRDGALYDVGVGASWELDLFGGLRRGAEATRAEAQALEADGRGARVSVAAETADAYLRIRQDQARLAIIADQVTTTTHLLDLVRLRVAKGVAAEQDAAQAEALLAQTKAAIHPLTIDLQAQFNRLDVLMGVQPGAAAGELAQPTAIPAAPVGPVQSDPGDLLRRRPDVIAAERRLAAANARIGQAIADYYPKVSLSGLLGFEGAHTGHLLKPSTYQPQALAGLRWRLFDFGRIAAEIRRARGVEAEALALYRLSILRAAEDVENAFTALVQLEAHETTLTSEVAALQRARDLNKNAYDHGVVALVEVLEADQQLLRARDELSQTRADVARAAVQTFRALGGGWSS